MFQPNNNIMLRYPNTFHTTACGSLSLLFWPARIHRHALRVDARCQHHSYATTAPEEESSAHEVGKSVNKTKRKKERVPRGFWSKLENQRQYFDDLGKQIGIEKLDDWYNVSRQDLLPLGARSLLSSYYGESLSRAIQTVYPEHSWEPTRFTKSPSGHWEDIQHQRQLFDALAKKLGIQQPNDWYKVLVRQVFAQDRGARRLLTLQYGGSLSRALQTIYPEHPWDPSRFAKVPRGHWHDLGNQRKFFDAMALELGIKRPEDWYNSESGLAVTKSKIGKRLLKQHYGGSLIRALQAIYPEHPWQVHRFPRVPKAFWSDMNNQRQYFDELARELGVQTLDDWYNISLKQVIARGALGLLEQYNQSLPRALQAIYPEHPWDLARFSRKPKGYWKDPRNHRQLFDGIARELGLKDLDDWYNVTLHDVKSCGGASILADYYSNSLVRALQAVYPEHRWLNWKFHGISLDAVETTLATNATTAATTATTTTTTTTFLSDLMAALAKELDIKHLDDWYRVSSDHIRDFGGNRYIVRNGGLFMVLKRLYPNHDWDESRFVSASGKPRKKSVQLSVLLAVKQLFPGTEIFEDYHFAGLSFAGTNEKMEAKM